MIHTRLPALPRRHALALLAAALPSLRLSAAEAAVRFALSESLVSGVNVNDARATMGIWMKRIGPDVGLDLAFDPRIFDTTEQLHRKVRSGTVDAVALNLLEYRPVAQFLDTQQVVSETDGAGMKYVVLVPAQSPVRHMKDLQGKRVTMLEGRAAYLAPYWLRSLAATDSPDRLFSALTTDAKPSQVILPVFFGRADACLTTQRSFQTMSELNPQVGQRLRVLETSPELISTFYVFRNGFHGTMRDKLQTALAELKNTISGRQLMVLFQFTDLQVRDISCLKPALQLLDAVDRLKAGHA